MKQQQEQVPWPPGRSRVKEEVNEMKRAWIGGALRPSKLED